MRDCREEEARTPPAWMRSIMHWWIHEATACTRSVGAGAYTPACMRPAPQAQAAVAVQAEPPRHPTIVRLRRFSTRHVHALNSLVLHHLRTRCTGPAARLSSRSFFRRGHVEHACDSGLAGCWACWACCA